MNEQEKRRFHLEKAIRSIDYGNNWDRFARALRKVDGASPYSGEDIRRRVSGEVRIDTEFVDYVAKTLGFSRRFLEPVRHFEVEPRSD